MAKFELLFHQCSLLFVNKRRASRFSDSFFLIGDRTSPVELASEPSKVSQQNGLSPLSQRHD